MLVVTRKQGEGVVFRGSGRPGRVVVVEIRGDRVRLGFDADPEVVIHRDEVAAAIKKKGKLRRLFGKEENNQ